MGHMSMLQAFYPHQTLLVTGASGFVGKVLLSQLLKSCPSKRIYVVLRPSAGRTAQERLLIDVFSSPAFEAMRNEHQDNWNNWISQRVVAVPGDLLQPDLGIRNRKLLKKLQEEVTVVIHMAASVHFNSPLKDNYRSNVEGTMRVLDFAKGCKCLQVFVHTSTCYVNSDHEGRVKEDILPLSWDTEELLTAVHRMIELRDQETKHPHLDVVNLEKQLLGRFPNTYTFTKRLSEALLIRDWEKALLQPESSIHFPLCMLRPSIVGAAYKHPRRGWIDNLNATGGMFLLSALGVLKCLPANPNLIGDNVPVDVVADALIVAGAAVAAAHAHANPKTMALAARADPAAAASIAAAKCVLPQYLPRSISLPKNVSPAPSALPSPTKAGQRDPSSGEISPVRDGVPGVYVIHCCTSDTNPVRWGDILYYGREYNMLNPFFNRITRDLQTPYFEGDFEDFRRKFFLLQRLPAAVMATLTNYLLPPSSALKRHAHMYHSGIQKVEKAAEAFHPFTYHEWVFEQNNMRKLHHLLAPEEKAIFLLKTEDLDWRSWTHYFFYGIARWLLNEQSGAACEPPPAPYVYINLLYKHVLNEPYNPPAWLARLMPYPDAVMFLRTAGPLPRCPSPLSIENAVMGSKAVASAIRREALQLSKLGKRRRRKNGKRAGTTIPEIEAEVREDAQELYSAIAGTISPPAVYLLGAVLHTSFLRLFDRIVVESTEVERLRKTIRESRGPVVFVPTHRSYMDFLLLSYMCFGNGMPLPLIAADESFAEIAVVHRLLRNAGAFFLKKGRSGKARGGGSHGSGQFSARLYCTVLRQYIHAISKRHGLLEIFLEGGRSKSGLLVNPKFGLLRTLLDLFFDNEQPNVTFVPVTISYDKVLEAESFPQELRGGEKEREGLSRVLSLIRRVSHSSGPDCKIQDAESSDGLQQQRFGIGSKPLGSAYIRIAAPVSFKSFLQGHLPEKSAERAYFSTLETSAAGEGDWCLGAKREGMQASGNAVKGESEKTDMSTVPGEDSKLGQPPEYRQRQEQEREHLEASTEWLKAKKIQPQSQEESEAMAVQAKEHSKVPDQLRRQLTAKFADHLMGVLSSNLIISPTSLVATILCMHPNGIREEDLEDQVQWLRDQVLLRNGILSPAVGGLMYDVRLIVQAVLQTYLKRVVSSNGGGWSALLNTGKGSPAGTSLGSVKRLTTSGGTVVGPMSADAPRLVLAYYRNQCCYPFVMEAIVTVALLSCGHEKAWEEGEAEESLREKVAFLMKILQGQFGKTIEIDDRHIKNAIDLAVSRGVLRRLPSPSASPSHQDGQGNRRYVFCASSECLVTLLAYFIWPFIDSYLACGMSFFTLQKQPAQSEENAAGEVENAAEREETAVTPLTLFRPRGDGKMTKAQLVARAHCVAEALHQEKFLSFPESSAYTAMRCAVDTFHKLGLLRECPADVLRSRGGALAPIGLGNSQRQKAPISSADLLQESSSVEDNTLLELSPEYHREETLHAFLDKLHQFRKAAVADGGTKKKARRLPNRQKLMASFPFFARL
ncbi:acyltransferase domain-containing protein [Cystoisospora suis]|uniref:Acyltransferase domain-containing protein n=1 Tax=Cystoisospora suis TaxID=483139 RepID=A0A2C6L6G5_9APIC|nr:acyltransferase domain-containing protein [Cystoisospora suis]